MHVDQTQIVDKNIRNHIDSGMGIAQYMQPELEKGRNVSGEFYQKMEMAGVSSKNSVHMGDATYGRPEKEDKKTAIESLAGEQGLSATARRNEMAVLANTTSEEDFAKLAKEGFSLSDTDIRTVVTVLDKIKAKLAQAGVDISGMGQSLSKEQLEKITGSSAVANQIACELESRNLPITTANVEDSLKALEQAASVDKLEPSEAAYLVSNQLPPTIENMYRAKHSNAEQMLSPNNLTAEDFNSMRPQMDNIIVGAGCEVNEQNRSQSEWMVANGVALTEDNLAYMNELMSFHMGSDGEVIQAMAESIEEGGRPTDAIVINSRTLKQRAEAAYQVVNEATEEDLSYVIEHQKEITTENLKIAANHRGEVSGSLVDDVALISARRQLEETRLAMTAQANYALLKKGISIETKPLVELVESLKEQENSYYKNLVMASDETATEEKVQMFRQTSEVLNHLKSTPAAVLMLELSDESLASLHERATVMQASYQKAAKSYETLMTKPNAEYGDTIEKAFRNVDDILTDLGIAKSERNRRAVRILGYNNSEISLENITVMKAKDEEVQRAFKNMTPKVTLEMIRKDINPLDMKLSDLNKVAQEIRTQDIGEDSERYSKYLWKLDQTKGISAEERESYIGIYRLIHQVEKSNGAAVGAVVNEGGELTMRNLLGAIRSKNKSGMEYEINESFAGVNAISKGSRIDDQIMSAYVNNCLHDIAEQMTPDKVRSIGTEQILQKTPEELAEEFSSMKEDASEVAYQREEMSLFARVLNSSSEVYEYMEEMQLDNSIHQVIAVEEMLQNANRMFETLWPKNNDSTSEELKRIKNQILERFGESLENPTELAKAQEELADVAEHALDDMVMEARAKNSLDVKAMKLSNLMLSTFAKKAQEESYMIPIETADGGVTGISLKIIRGEDKKGFVDILFQTEGMGKVAATFEAKESGISGMIATDEEQTRALLSDQLMYLSEMMNESGDEPLDIKVAFAKDLSLSHYEKQSAHKKNETEEGLDRSIERPVQTQRLYHIAESFILSMQELLS